MQSMDFTALSSLLTKENLGKLSNLLSINEQSENNDLPHDEQNSKAPPRNLQKKIDIISAVLPYMEGSSKDTAKKLLDVLKTISILYTLLDN